MIDTDFERISYNFLKSHIMTEVKTKYVIGFNCASKAHNACCVIAKEENGKMVVIDFLASKYDDEVKSKVEEYDPEYFSLNSIHDRRIKSLELRNRLKIS